MISTKVVCVCLIGGGAALVGAGVAAAGPVPDSPVYFPRNNPIVNSNPPGIYLSNDQEENAAASLLSALPKTSGTAIGTYMLGDLSQYDDTIRREGAGPNCISFHFTPVTAEMVGNDPSLTGKTAIAAYQGWKPGACD